MGVAYICSKPVSGKQSKSVDWHIPCYCSSSSFTARHPPLHLFLCTSPSLLSLPVHNPLSAPFPSVIFSFIVIESPYATWGNVAVRKWETSWCCSSDCQRQNKSLWQTTWRLIFSLWMFPKLKFSFYQTQDHLRQSSGSISTFAWNIHVSIQIWDISSLFGHSILILICEDKIFNFHYFLCFDLLVSVW